MARKSSLLAFAILNFDGTSFDGTLYVSPDDISYVMSGSGSGGSSSTSWISFRGDSPNDRQWLVTGTASEIVDQVGASELYQITFFNQSTVQPYLRLDAIRGIYPSDYDSGAPSGAIRIVGDGFGPQDIAASDEAALVAALGRVTAIT